ncbi:MAG: MBL fold metallo-hydrolase [Pseudomonadota bacterium]
MSVAAADAGLTVAIWGCRGSIPTAGPATQRYGGETSCYELRAGGRSLVVDAGSGLRALGARMTAEGAAPDALSILLTHPHLDHLLGLSAFAPLIARRTEVAIWTPRPVEEVARALGHLFAPPLWPLDLMGGRWLGVRRIESGAPTMVDGFEATPFPLTHPGGASGYRLRRGGRTVTVVTDHEHGDAAVDAGVRAMADGADLLIYDAAYAQSEYDARRGWGHSTWEMGARLAAETGAKRTLLTHHAPERDDAALDAAAARLAADGAAGVGFARDGLVITLPSASAAAGA